MASGRSTARHELSELLHRRLASKFVKVCLSGAGGDELFGGYPWRYYRVFRSLNRDDYLANYYGFWQRLTTANDRKKLFGASADDEQEMFDVFRSVYANAHDLSFNSPENQISAALYFECRTFLSSLLTVGDKLAMASGLEERFPFLDNALVDFAMRLPVSHKLADLAQMLSVDEDAVRKKLLAEESFSGGKSCLRRAMTDLLPPEIMNRQKAGFFLARSVLVPRRERRLCARHAAGIQACFGRLSRR